VRIARQRLSLRGLGSTLDVVVEDGAALDLLKDLFTDLTSPRRDPAPLPDALVLVLGSGPWLVSSPGHNATAHDEQQLVAAALAAVNLTFVATTHLLALHAGVLVRGDRVLVLPGPSGRGKSTLTAALLRRGWLYVSDEALCLHWDDGSIVPYPRPMALSPWSADLVSVTGRPADGEVAVRAVNLDASAAVEVPAVTDVVLMVRDGSPPRLDAVSGQAVLGELLQRSFTHFLRPQRALQLYSDIARSAACRQLRLGDPLAAAALLDEAL
jgi:hypothetical protein